MTSYKVSYGRCLRTTFLNNKRTSKLVPGRLYFIKDTGEILRATNVNSYESYTNRIHVVEDWPATFDSGNIYIKENGRAKIVVQDDAGNDTIIELRGEGGGGGAGDLSQLQADVEQIKSQLTWKAV